MSKKLKIRIFPDGKVQAETEGIKGKKCIDYINILEDLLEAKTVDSDYTEEYYQKEKVNIEQENLIYNENNL